MEHHFSLLDLVLPHGSEVAKFQPTLSASIIALLLIVIAAAVRGRFAATNAAIIPDGSITLTAVLDQFLSGLMGMMHDIVGPEYKRHLWFVGSLALFILVSNLSGLFPGMLPPTQFIATTAACALMVFIYYNYHGIRKQGLIGHLKHFAGPVWWISPLMFPVEIISHLARPMSLAFRLFGNIFADHLVLGVVMGLVPLIVPVPLMILGLLVCFVQTGIFTILTLVYVGMAVEEHHHEGDAHH